MAKKINRPYTLNGIGSNPNAYQPEFPVTDEGNVIRKMIDTASEATWALKAFGRTAGRGEEEASDRDIYHKSRDYYQGQLDACMDVILSLPEEQKKYWVNYLETLRNKRKNPDRELYVV